MSRCSCSSAPPARSSNGARRLGERGRGSARRLEQDHPDPSNSGRPRLRRRRRETATASHNVFFSSDVYGMDFEANVLAVTTTWRRGSARTEADVIFNAGRLVDAYDGTLKRSPTDFRRVALHEFRARARPRSSRRKRIRPSPSIMNSHVSDLDRLTPDDIAGAQSLAAAEPRPAAGSAADPSRSRRETSRSTSAISSRPSIATPARSGSLHLGRQRGRGRLDAGIPPVPRESLRALPGGRSSDDGN